MKVVLRWPFWIQGKSIDRDKSYQWKFSLWDSFPYEKKSKKILSGAKNVDKSLQTPSSDSDKAVKPDWH